MAFPSHSRLRQECASSPPFILRILAFEGQAHAHSIRGIVPGRVRSTFNYQMKWLFSWYTDLGKEGASRGTIPWFQGPGAGAKPYVEPWGPTQDNWPDMDTRNLNAAEYSVAKAVRESLVEHIHKWRSRRTAGSGKNAQALLHLF